MRHISTLAILIFFSFFCSTAFAQPIRCGTDSRKFTGEFAKQFEKRTANVSGKMLSPASADSIIIPLVVHIIYHTQEENLSDEQVKSQIDVLNEDFGGNNATTLEVPNVWRSFLTDSKIRFCLALRTASPNNPQNTNGIERKYSPIEAFNAFTDTLKISALGGSDAWNTKKYLNIWVCNLEDNLLGYSTFPLSDTLRDGVVINYKAFGRKGDLYSRYNYGRTLTHEIGHYLNLVHIWGDDDPDFPCSNDDNIDDTPLQAVPTYCCPSFPKYDACQTSGNGIMYMNYMDYTDDKYMEFFTPDQIARMDTAINNFRNSLFLSLGCYQPFTWNNDLGIKAITSPVIQPEGRCFTPQILVANYGMQTANSYTVEYDVNNGNVKKLFVGAALLPNHDTLISLPEISGKEKLNVLEVRIKEADSNQVNNYASRSFYTTKGSTNGCDDGDPFIYPNPVVSNSFCAKSNFTVSQDIEIRLINLLGQKVSSQFVKGNPGDTFNISFDKNPEGVYFVQMIGSESGSRASKVLYLPGSAGANTSSPCE